MPTYLLTSPDGKQYKVTGDGDGQAALAQLKQHLGGPSIPGVDTTGNAAGAQGVAGPGANGPQAAADGKVDANGSISAQSYAEDMAKSLGSGLVKGATTLLGAPQDIGRYLGDKAIQGIESLRGVPPEQVAQRMAAGQEKAKAMAVLPAPPTSDEALAAAQKVTGPLHTPQTVPGEYAQTVGEFAPNAAFGGGGLVKRAVQTVVPAVASEAAGQVTKGTPLEPLARLGGALAGGAVTALPEAISGGFAKGKVLNAAPTHDAVQSTTNQMYDTLRNAGVKYDANGFSQAVGDLTQKLDKAGMIPELAPMSTGAMKLLTKHVGDSPDFNDVNNARRIASGILREKTASSTDKEFAQQIADSIDKYVGSAAYVHDGSVPNVGGMVRQAREMARRNILANQIDDMVGQAQTYQSGFQSGLQNQFSNYLRSAKASSLTDVERAAFQNVAKGNFTRNALTILGKFGIDLSSLGHNAAMLPAAAATTAAHFSGSLVDGGATLAGATAAKFAARKMTESAANSAKKTVLSGIGGQNRLTQIQQSIPSSVRPQAINTLSALAGLNRNVSPNALSQFLLPSTSQ